MKKILYTLLSLIVFMTMLTAHFQYVEYLKNQHQNAEQFDNEPPYTTNANYIHISFDDVSTCFSNLSTESYSNLFEEPFFAKLKELHSEYNAKFSLYTYNNVLNLISNKYSVDFANNSSWLKIGLHSNTTGLSLSSSTYNDGLTFWNNFIANIERICGTTDCVDRIPRLEYFSGSYECLLGMRDANHGALGFLSADDNRLSYYFNSNVMTYLYDNDYLKDEAENLLFISTDMRADWFYNFSSNNLYKKPIKTNLYNELVYRNKTSNFDSSFKSLIVFTHEQLVYNGSNINTKFNSIVYACQFAKQYSISFDYAQNREYPNTDNNSLFDNVPA